MDNHFQEIYDDVEKAIDYAFQGKFVLKFYEYLKIRSTKKVEIEKFIESSTVNNINSVILDLDEYIEGGTDSIHKQLREAYGHIPKPQARKIRNYLFDILEDARRYDNDRRPGRKKKQSK
jgi:uncharacterized protein with HEPN domain